MLSVSAFVHLPAEIIEAVGLHLDFNDTCNLRLTAQEVAAKASQGSFKARFASKSVVMSLENLRLLVTVTQLGWLGCTLEHLTVIGTVSAVEDEAYDLQDPETAELFAKALSQLRANTRTGRLRSLSLALTGTATSVNLRYACDWHHIWAYAGDTACIVAQAIKASTMPVHTLDFYGSTPRCALSPWRLQAAVDKLQLPELRSLSPAVSGPENGECENENAGLGPCVSNLIAQSPSLEHLDIRWFDLRSPDLSASELKDRQFFTELTTLFLASLTSASLRGVYANSEDLQAFLERHSHLRHLRLEDVYLGRGGFERVFAQITALHSLESLYLSDLYVRLERATFLTQVPQLGSSEKDREHRTRSRTSS